MRLEICRDELHSLLSQEKLVGASLLIFANKQDVKDACTSEEIVDILELRTNPIYSKRHWSIFACSAITGAGLVDGIDWMTKDIASRIFMLL